MNSWRYLLALFIGGIYRRYLLALFIGANEIFGAKNLGSRMGGANFRIGANFLWVIQVNRQKPAPKRALAPKKSAPNRVLAPVFFIGDNIWRQ